MSRFLKDTSFNLVGHFAMMVLGLSNGVILARVLGEHGKGIFAALFLIPQLLNALMASGFATSIVYFVSSKKWTDSEVLPRVIGLACWIIGAVLLTGVVCVFFGGGWMGGVPFASLYVGLGVIPWIIYMQSFTALLQGKQAFRDLFRFRVLAAILMLAGTILGLIVTGATPMGAFLGRLAGSILAGVFLFQLARKAYPNSSWKPATDLRALRPAVSYGGRAHAANALAFLNYRADQFLVTAMISPAALGVYTVAVTWAEMLWMVAGNASAALLPRLASEQDESKTVQITSQLARVMLIFVCATTVFFGAVAALLIPVLYPQGFQGAVTAFLVLLPGIVAMAYTKVISNYLAAIGKPELNAKNATIGLIVNLLGNAILIPQYAIVGAAMATSISYASIGVLCYRDYLRLTNSRWSEPVVIRRDDVVQSMAMVRAMIGPLLTRFSG